MAKFTREEAEEINRELNMTELSVVRWGILSTAWINEAIIPAIAMSPRSELIAVASRTQEKVDNYAEKHGIPRAYGSYVELLADSDVDAVYVSLPNSLHAEWIVKAARAGKHVLCEKPLVINLEEFKSVEAAAREFSVVVFEAFANLHHPSIRQALEMVESGVLGDVQFINGRGYITLPPEDLDNIRLKPELGGGSLWDIGVYPVSLAIMFAGVGAPVEVWGRQITGVTGVDIAFAGQMRFANDVTAQISSGICSPPNTRLVIVGEDGTLELRYPTIPMHVSDQEMKIEHTTSSGEKKTIVIPVANQYQMEVDALAACILDGAQPVVPLSDSREFLITNLALYESAKIGRPVRTGMPLPSS